MAKGSGRITNNSARQGGGTPVMETIGKNASLVNAIERRTLNIPIAKRNSTWIQGTDSKELTGYVDDYNASVADYNTMRTNIASLKSSEFTPQTYERVNSQLRMSMLYINDRKSTVSAILKELSRRGVKYKYKG